MFSCNRNKILLLVLLSTILTGFFTGYILSKTRKKLVNVDETYFSAAVQVFNEVKNNIFQVRNLRPPETLELKVVDVNWVKRTWGTPSVKSLEEEIKVKEKIYKILNMISEEVNLSQVKISETGYFIAASFEGKIYVVKENFNPFDKERAREIFAHEITHVLQSQYFEIPQPKTYDEKQALSALIEGDAGLTAKFYLNFTRKNKAMGKKEVCMKTETVSVYFTPEVNQRTVEYASPSSQIPRPLLMLWMFPYDYGEKFVRKLYWEGGWEMVNNAYSKAPMSTEQVMHPEKYIKHESFLKPDAPTLNESGWLLKRKDRMGEHFIYVMLTTWLNDSSAREAAEGWNGDNLTFDEKENNYSLIWKICWDTEEDLKEFREAYMALLRGINASEINKKTWITNKSKIIYQEQSKCCLIIIFKSETQFPAS